jgi:alpha-beta hydrolase superfamily lysophospholipase
MIERFAQFPRSLAERAQSARFGEVPALLVHPNWQRPAPVMLWLHGRTVQKELDPGRYLRWMRAGIAACAIDLPGHGERKLDGWDHPDRTLDVLAQVIGELDGVLEGLASPKFAGFFDLDRVAIGGMSLGGMATLRRLCDPHPFVCAAVEATTGWLEGLYFPDTWNAPPSVRRWPTLHDPARVRPLDALAHMETTRPIPVLALHSRADEVVAFEVQERYLDRLRTHYALKGHDPSVVELHTWASTGAPQEHSGFGRVAAEAKSLQVEFLTRWLRPTAQDATG